MKIRQLRKANKEKPAKIAGMLGVAVSTYRSYENGNRELPLPYVKKLATYWKVSLDTLVGFSISNKVGDDQKAA